MNLISCDSCGIVLDKAKLKFPNEIYNQDGSIDSKKAQWSETHYEFVSKVECPVCRGEILNT